MIDADEYNPYAAPKTDKEQGEYRRHATGHVTADVREALDRLNEHLQDPAAVEGDRRARGPRIRVATWISGGVLAASLVLTAVGFAGSQEWAAPVGIVVGIIALILFAVLFTMDLRLASRDEPREPQVALKSYFLSIPMGRYGYAWSALCPTAREQQVLSPSLGPVSVTPGSFTPSDPNGFKAYAGSFARPGDGQMRTMGVKNVVVGQVDGDVAEVTAELSFQSWPRWVTILAAVGFALFRPLVLIGGVLYFVMRKQHKTRVTKTMLRGSNGVWYVYDADMLEGAESR